jgi:hypothetical protein
MKNLGLWLALLLASAGAVSAQVEVEVVLDQNQFLPSEATPAIVRIVNHSGQTLHFGKDNWLTFSVEARDGYIVSKNGEVPIAHEFDLGSSRVAKVHVDLAPYFSIAKLGSYSVTASVNLDQWSTQLTSVPRKFEVIGGTRIWELEFGVPATASATNHGEPEVRKYILQQASYLKHIKLYLRVAAGDESRVIRVFPIGPMISFSRPQTQLDKLCNLHLLYQDGSRTFNYSVINPDGEVIARQTHHYTDSPPRLKVDQSGNVLVLGGMRVLADSDFPPAPISTALDNLPPPTKSSNSDNDFPPELPPATP